MYGASLEIRGLFVADIGGQASASSEAQGKHCLPPGYFWWGQVNRGGLIAQGEIHLRLVAAVRFPKLRISFETHENSSALGQSNSAFCFQMRRRPKQLFGAAMGKFGGLTGRPNHAGG